MKSFFTACALGLSLATVGAANASEELAKKNLCLSCHSLDAKKVGPAFKVTAAKYKGKGDAQEFLVAKIKAGKGGVGGHPKVKVSEADADTLVKWVLSL